MRPDRILAVYLEIYGLSLIHIYVLGSLEEKKKRLEELENYDFLKQQTEKKLASVKKELSGLSAQLTAVRQEVAKELTAHIEEGLRELNFLDVKFTMEFRPLDHYTSNGRDEAEFMISTNPGEPVRPLGMVASGGELSRIMPVSYTHLDVYKRQCDGRPVFRRLRHRGRSPDGRNGL